MHWHRHTCCRAFSHVRCARCVFEDWDLDFAISVVHARHAVRCGLRDGGTLGLALGTLLYLDVVRLYRAAIVTQGDSSGPPCSVREAPRTYTGAVPLQRCGFRNPTWSPSGLRPCKLLCESVTVVSCPPLSQARWYLRGGLSGLLPLPPRPLVAWQHQGLVSRKPYISLPSAQPYRHISARGAGSSTQCIIE